MNKYRSRVTAKSMSLKDVVFDIEHKTKIDTWKKFREIEIDYKNETGETILITNILTFYM